MEGGVEGRVGPVQHVTVDPLSMTFSTASCIGERRKDRADERTLG